MESISENAGGGQTVVKKKSWRDVIKVHPAADIFPMLPEEELRKLGADIKEHGLHEPILFWSPVDPPITADHPFFLLDGRNRVAAMELVGILQIREDNRGFHHPGLPNDMFVNCYTDTKFSGLDPGAYVISKNIRRRHLTKEQQADLIVKVMKAGTDFAKLARSVKRDSNGRVQGSKKYPIKEKAVEEATKHGISKRTMERAIAKDRGPKTPKRRRAEEKQAEARKRKPTEVKLDGATVSRLREIETRINKSDESGKIDKSVLYICQEVDRILRAMRADQQKIFLEKLFLALDKKT